MSEKTCWLSCDFPLHLRRSVCHHSYAHALDRGMMSGYPPQCSAVSTLRKKDDNGTSLDTSSNKGRNKKATFGGAFLKE